MGSQFATPSEENKANSHQRVRSLRLMLKSEDVASILGYANPTKACRVHIEEDDRLMYKMDTSFGVKDTLLINESGLYSLILSSKLPDAKKFKRWVTSVVIPKERSPRCLRMASVRMGGSWQQRYA